jgi:hypothetical protein
MLLSLPTTYPRGYEKRFVILNPILPWKPSKSDASVIASPTQLRILFPALRGDTMEELENRRAVELVNKLHIGEGVIVCSTGELFLIVYPKEKKELLSGFTKKDLEKAIEQKLLKKADILQINDAQFPVYMKTENVANKDLARKPSG